MANVLVKCDVYECSLDKSRIRPMLFSPAGSSALATYLVIGYTQLVPKFVRSGSAYCGSPLFEAGSICVNPKRFLFWYIALGLLETQFTLQEFVMTHPIAYVLTIRLRFSLFLTKIFLPIEGDARKRIMHWRN